jgi:hypothetical protein
VLVRNRKAHLFDGLVLIYRIGRRRGLYLPGFEGWREGTGKPQSQQNVEVM